MSGKRPCAPPLTLGIGLSILSSYYRVFWFRLYFAIPDNLRLIAVDVYREYYINKTNDDKILTALKGKNEYFITLNKSLIVYNRGF